MIYRFGAFLLVLYALGFALFGVSLAAPAPDNSPPSDAIVAITGGEQRIERAIAVLGQHKGKRLLVAGTDPSVTKADLVARIGPASARLFRCCVDLGSESVDTRSNAEEARRWVRRHGYRSVRLITSDWHMRRAIYEFRRQLGPGVTIVPDAVRTEPHFMTLFAEYNKYLLRRVSVLLDL